MDPTVDERHHPGQDRDLLLERGAELESIERFLAGVAGGHGDVLRVAGPAGIGKTRLLMAVRERAGAHGVSCRWARGGELERDFSYGVVRQLLERPVADLSPRERGRVLAGAAGAAGPVVGVEGDAPRGAEAFATVHGLYWLCANLAQRGPLALVVDDAHWADEASLRFLAYLARRIDELPLGLVLAMRPSGDAGAGTHPAHFAEDVGLLLVPCPLGPQSIERVLRSATGRPPDPLLVAACLEATAGNPFLCATFAAALAQDGMSGDPRRLLDLVVRERGRAVLHRVGTLPDEELRLARAVAVLGTDVPLRDAALLAGLDEEVVAAASAGLAARGILRRELPLDFVHPLVRAALREGVPGAERALMHARAARNLDRAGAPPDRVAAHLLGAEPAARPWVVAALRGAARIASVAGDPAAATAYLARALREPPDSSDRAGVLHELGVAELHSGQAESAASHLADAVALITDPRVGAQVGQDLATAQAAFGNYTDAVAALEEALGRLADPADDLASELDADLYQSAMMEPGLYGRGRARITGRDGIPAGDSAGERALLATLATEGCLGTTGAGIVAASAVRAFERGLLGDRALHSSLWGNAAFPLIFADGFTEAARVLTDAAEAARASNSVVGSVRVQTIRAMLALRTGNVRDAEADARGAIELGLEADLQVAAIALGVLVMALIHQGELDGADAVLGDTGRDGELRPTFLESWVLEARGWLRLAQARHDDAASDFTELGRRGDEGWQSWNPGMFAYRSGLALALARQGRRDPARELAADELVRARAWGAPRAVGIALRTTGLLEGGARRIALLHESVAVLDGSGARLEHAASLVDLGAAIRRAGRRTEAREPLYAGMEAAVRCSAGPLAARAREELVAAGARPRRAHRSGVEALTASELRVARLAVSGLTNREIAETLFVTLRTVQLHLTGAYRKLGITGRAGLAETLSPGGAAPSLE